MPVHLLLHAERTPRFTDRASREPAWKILHRLADAAYPHLYTLWATLFADVRDQVDAVALQAALAQQNLVVAEELLRTAWTRTVTPAQAEVLLPLLRDTVAQAAAATVPVLEATASIQITFNVVVPEALAAIDAYAAAQVVGITDSTMLALRQTLREGFAQGTPLTQLITQIEQQIGVTPRQASSLARLRERLRAREIPANIVEQQIQEATRRALRLRAEIIARTESIAAAHLGQDSIWREAIAQGLLDETRLRRQWIVTPDERLCTRICRPIPGFNPQGRRLDEPFVTPVGSVHFPPAHPACRCALNAVVQ